MVGQAPGLPATQGYGHSTVEMVPFEGREHRTRAALGTGASAYHAPLPQDRLFSLRNEIARQIESAEIPVKYHHHEVGPFGQVEVELGFAPLLRMADATLIIKHDAVSREVGHQSCLPDPIVTGYEDGCFQPWVTVTPDRQTRRFRMWYNMPASPGNADASRLAHIESNDGIHWIRPHRLCETPPIQYGASVLDEGPVVERDVLLAHLRSGFLPRREWGGRTAPSALRDRGFSGRPFSLLYWRR